MKNYLYFKVWLAPLMIIAFSLSNMTQTNAQAVRILDSDPRKGGGDDTRLCSDMGSNSFAFYLQIRDDISVNINEITIEGAGLNPIIAESVTYESPINNLDVNTGETFLWMCAFSLENSLHNYMGGQEEINIQVSYSYFSGNGNLTSSTTSEGAILPYNALTGTLSFSICIDEEQLDDPVISKYRKAEKQKEIIVDNIYPNPTNNNITIELSTDEELEISVDVLDHIGKRIKSITIKDGGKIKEDISLSSLPKGVYYLSISSRDDVIIKKIMKL